MTTQANTLPSSKITVKKISLPMIQDNNAPTRSRLLTQQHIETMKLLAEVVHNHSWTFATVDAVARSVIGSGWKIIENDNFKGSPSKRNRQKALDFLNYEQRDWSNIRDYVDFPSKLYQTVASMRLFGQASWHFVRSGSRVVGFDVLSGITIPNVDSSGNLLSPAFIHKPWDNAKEIEFDADEIAYFFHPGVTGRILGESIYESLVDISLPADIYAAISYRSVLENVNAPYNGVWVVDPSVSDDDFEMFVQLLQERYSGPENYGRNPLVIRGMAEFKELETKRSDNAPYIGGREFGREEVFGVTGVASNKLGLSSDFNKANIRETRREFHESVLRPIFEVIESGIYNQVFRRALGISDWKFTFNQPDITTSLERASIDMRYLQWGVFSPNEIRRQHGEPPREDGDEYYVPSITTVNSRQPKSGQQGKKEVDTEENPDTSTNPIPVERPPRDEASISNSADAIRELKNWRKIVLEHMDGKRASQSFTANVIPLQMAEAIQEMIEQADNDFDVIKRIFSAAIDMIKEINNEAKQ